LKYSENGNAKVQRFPRTITAPNATGLRAAILGLHLPSPFTVDDVVSALEAKHFRFDERSPKAAVRDCLYVLHKKRKGIRRLEQGTGGQPSRYEKASV